jgi:hypothetical protein
LLLLLLLLLLPPPWPLLLALLLAGTLAALAISALLATSPMRSIMPPTHVVSAPPGARSNSLNLSELLPAFSTSTRPRPCSTPMVSALQIWLVN